MNYLLNKSEINQKSAESLVNMSLYAAVPHCSYVILKTQIKQTK